MYPKAFTQWDTVTFYTNFLMPDSGHDAFLTYAVLLLPAALWHVAESQDSKPLILVAGCHSDFQRMLPGLPLVEQNNGIAVCPIHFMRIGGHYMLPIHLYIRSSEIVASINESYKIYKPLRLATGSCGAIAMNCNLIILWDGKLWRLFNPFLRKKAIAKKYGIYYKKIFTRTSHQWQVRVGQ